MKIVIDLDFICIFELFKIVFKFRFKIKCIEFGFRILRIKVFFLFVIKVDVVGLFLRLKGIFNI